MRPITNKRVLTVLPVTWTIIALFFTLSPGSDILALCNQNLSEICIVYSCILENPEFDPLGVGILITFLTFSACRRTVGTKSRSAKRFYMLLGLGSAVRATPAPWAELRSGVL
jgi:hypothetical protein